MGQPKVFDNYTLTLMLENLSKTLLGMQFIDQPTLAKAFGYQQGFQSTEFASSLTISTLPTPGLKQEDITKTGNVDSKGNPLPNSTQNTTTKTQDSIKPQAPTLDTAPPAVAGYNPTYGPNPSDLLSDQVNLSYQIFNLRMILEKSLSDRLLNNDKTRLQAVLGFNVSLDPPRTANDAVAVVEITVEAQEEAGQTDGLSLISMMPQEKTYNSAAVSTKSNAFGGSAVVKLVEVGYSQRKRSQVFYLYRDTDTLSYQRMIPGDNSNGEKPKIVFGWMFRPVLGRRSISPGLRQLFAILALPQKDQQDKIETKKQECGKQGGENPPSAAAPLSPSAPKAPSLKATVRTYWKKYDRQTMTSFEEHDANRATKAGYYLSLGLNKPQIFSDTYENSATYDSIEVKPTGQYENDLQARISSVVWRPVGSKAALVSVEGKNFFTETKIAIGDKVYATPADGLIIKSNETMDLAIPLDALSTGPGAIISRYGGAVPLTFPCPVLPPGAPDGGVEIDHVSVTDSLADTRTLRIYLRSRDVTRVNGEERRRPLSLKYLPEDAVNRGRLSIPATPVVSVNGNVVPLPYTFVDSETSGQLILEGNMPNDSVASGGAVVKISWPFLPPDKWTSTQFFYDESLTFEITRVSDNTIFIKKHDALGFTKDPQSRDIYGTPQTLPFCWTILAGDEAQKLRTSTCRDGKSGPTDPTQSGLSVKLEKAIPDKVILLAPNGRNAFPLDVPKLKTSGSDTPKPITIKQYDSAWIDIAGVDIAKVGSVEANHLSLLYRKPKDAKGAGSTTAPPKGGKAEKKIQVEVTRDLTAKPGDVEISVLDKAGALLTSIHIQISCVEHCTDNGGK